VFEDTADLASLKASGAGFDSLDVKLLNAVHRITDNSPKGVLLETVIQREVAAKRQINGRQALLVVVQSYGVSGSQGLVYGLTTLMKVDWQGDGELAKFLALWDRVLLGMGKHRPSDAHVEEIFLAQLKKSRFFEQEVRKYTRLPDGHTDKSYQKLYTMNQDEIAQRQLEQNRKGLSNSIGSSSTARALPAAPPAKKENCTFFMQGRCTKGAACAFVHPSPPGEGKKSKKKKSKKDKEEAAAPAPANPAPKKGAGKGKRGRSESRQPSSSSRGGSSSSQTSRSSQKSDAPCYAFIKRECKRGADCKFQHRPLSALSTEEKAKWEEFKNKPPRSPRASSPTGSSTVCVHWPKGECRFGANCRFKREGQGGSLTPAAKGKAKAKGKSSPR
jgi:hypothetical protein